MKHGRFRERHWSFLGDGGVSVFQQADNLYSIHAALEEFHLSS